MTNHPKKPNQQLSGTPRPEFCQKPGGKRRFTAYAHFPGTGPKGKYCLNCNYFDWPQGRTDRVCRKWKELTNFNGKKQPGIVNAAACKYFEQATKWNPGDRKNES